MPDEAIRVIVRWLTRAEGGRRRPFVGDRYCPTISLAGSADARMWSAVIDIDHAEAPAVGSVRFSAGRLRFLAPDAPRDRLAAGASFLVHEGRAVVALCSRDTVCGG
jgi:hypothetical protein